MKFNRRDFLATAALSSASMAFGQAMQGQNTEAMHDHMQDHAAHNHPKPEKPKVPRLPAVLCRKTATVGIDAAYSLLAQGADTLDAALHITKSQEDDPNDASTGLGGLPNERGEVQLDACCFHGPTRRQAAVAAVSGIRNASLLARTLMDTTGCSLLAGSDANQFALEQKFSKEDLVTDRTRKVWMLWKQIHALHQPSVNVIHDPESSMNNSQQLFLSTSERDLDQLVAKYEPLAAQVGLEPRYTWRGAYDALFPAATPLYVAAVNEKQEISCAASSSGLPWRRPGASSDIAILGSGCYLDPEVGSAGASGSAAANIKVAGAHLIVECMRRGMSPDQAGMTALRRIAQWYKNDETALRFVEVTYYILRKDGAYASVSLWRGDRTGHVQQFTIHDGVRRSEDCLFLFDSSPANGCHAAPCREA